MGSPQDSRILPPYMGPMIQNESATARIAQAAAPAPAPRRKRRLRRHLLLAAAALVALPVLVPLLLVPVYAVVDPISTPMLQRYFTGRQVDRRWVPLENVSDQLEAAVMMSEDGQFCRHHGVDVAALRDEMRVWWEGGTPRGASTITMQVARNLFLWNDRSVVRKALEIPLALYIDLVLSKQRIMEIYLNIAQWGPAGEFGIEAGARSAFGVGAGDLGWQRAALMAASLPNPLVRRPESPGPQMRRVARVVEERARKSGPYTACLG